MAKEKVTITADRRRIDEAKELTGVSSTSRVIELAIDHLIRAHRLRRDVAAYTSSPPTHAEIALAATTPSWTDLADDTDWEALYEAD